MWSWIVVSHLLILVATRSVPDPEESQDLFEGDIEPEPRNSFRSSIGNRDKLWPNGRVPYEIVDPKGKITAAQRQNITRAIQTFHDHTCLRFFEREDPNQKSFLIFKKGNGCSSNVGMMNSYEVTGIEGQVVRLSDNCFEVGKIMHEMMHSIGFFHEQSRIDRDQYVKIVPQNIEQGKMAQFRLHDVSKQSTNLGAPYDYGSLMHYPRWAFSNGNGKDTIIPIYEAEIGQRRAISEIDVWKINKLYNCPNLGPVPDPHYGKKVEIGNEYPVESSLECTFDYEYTCGMRDEVESDFDFKVGNGKSSKHIETGPSTSSEGEACCYMHISTIGKDPGKTATLVSPVISPSREDGTCVRFYYHMFGNTIGSLKVFWRKVGGRQEHPILSESGNKGDRWIKKSFLLHSDTNYEVVFRATVGGDEYESYEGNIALDNIDIIPMYKLNYRKQKCE